MTMKAVFNSQTNAWENVPMSPEEQAEWDAAAAAAAVSTVPASVSDRQFAQALALSGFLTEAEAIAWASAGTLPASLVAIVDSLPDAPSRFAARMLLSSARDFERAHPLVEQVRIAQSLTAEQVDDLFRLAGSL
jgi:hypothetical protein